MRVIHTENRGLLLARRTAFENARGDYFIFFDSDDTVDPKIFTLINEEIQKSHCDMVFFDLSKCYSDGTSAHEKLFDERKTFDKSNKRELWELSVPEMHKTKRVRLYFRYGVLPGLQPGRG